MPYQGVAIAVLIGVGLATAAFLYFFEESPRRQRRQQHQQRPYQNNPHADYEPVNSWSSLRPTSSTNNDNNNTQNKRSQKPCRGDCTICMDTMDEAPDSSIRALTCSHQFHAECITKWMEVSPECPVCRTRQL